MQVSGRLLVLSTIAISVAMAVGAWLYNYSQSLQTARFWGKQDASLIVGAKTVELLELADVASEGDDRIAGRNVSSRFDLSTRYGLVHLRHELTQDHNFSWDALDRDAGDDDKWVRALRFAQGERELVILFHADFGRLGRVADNGRVEALPCPRLGQAIEKYLARVGAPGFASASDTEDATR
jgi:hypothetical protein